MRERLRTGRRLGGGLKVIPNTPLQRFNIFAEEFSFHDATATMYLSRGGPSREKLQ
jgi:hypothetical protein